MHIVLSCETVGMVSLSVCTHSPMSRAECYRPCALC